MNFVKSNYIFLIWVVFYAIVLILFAMEDITIFYTLLICQLISIIIALSPLGEWLLRITSGARKIRTKQDQDYLLPLFFEVYESALSCNKKLSQKVKLYIVEDKSVNAFAVGCNTIALNRGAIDSLDENELKGIIAHEMGHLNNGDTKVKLVMMIGNGLFSIFMFLFKLILSMDNDKDSNAFLMLIPAFISFVVASFFAIGNRSNEYKADQFAYEIGYGDGLLETLYLLKEIEMGNRISLVEKLKSSHPALDKRIERLEILN